MSVSVKIDAVTSVAYGRQFDLTYAFHRQPLTPTLTLTLIPTLTSPLTSTLTPTLTHSLTLTPTLT